MTGMNRDRENPWPGLLVYAGRPNRLTRFPWNSLPA